MKYYLIVIFIASLFYSCSTRDREYIEYYGNGQIKIKAFLKNNLPEGKAYQYFETGQLHLIQNFKQGKLHGYQKELVSPNDAVVVTSVYNSGELIEQMVYDTISSKVVSTFKNNIAKIYNNGRLMIITCSKDTSDIKYIKFNEDRTIKAYKGPLGFLTKDDSIKLTQSYPNWIEMSREWEKQHVKKEN